MSHRPSAAPPSRPCPKKCGPRPGDPERERERERGPRSAQPRRYIPTSALSLRRRLRAPGPAVSSGARGPGRVGATGRHRRRRASAGPAGPGRSAPARRHRRSEALLTACRRCSARRGAPGEGRVWGRRGAGRGGIGREPWTAFPAGPAAGESEPHGGTESHGRRGNVTHGPIPEARRDPRSDGMYGPHWPRYMESAQWNRPSGYDSMYRTAGPTVRFLRFRRRSHPREERERESPGPGHGHSCPRMRGPRQLTGHCHGRGGGGDSRRAVSTDHCVQGRTVSPASPGLSPASPLTRGSPLTRVAH